MLSSGTAPAWVAGNSQAASRSKHVVTENGHVELARRGAASLLLSAAAGAPALAKEQEIPPGYVPGGLFAKKLGEKITTPNGVIYEPLALGTEGNSNRDGPPRSGANLEVKFVGRTGGFDGPIFDSTILRGARKPNKQDFVEARINVDPGVSKGLCEALKLMKVGAKGRAVIPGPLNYGEGKVDYAGDEDGEVKEKVKKDEPTYYEIELVRIIKP
jgi:hypothetical protein